MPVNTYIYIYIYITLARVYLVREIKKLQISTCDDKHAVSISQYQVSNYTEYIIRSMWGFLRLFVLSFVSIPLSSMMDYSAKPACNFHVYKN